MIEAHEAVVNAIVAKLGADVAQGDAWQGLVGLHVAELHQEGMGAMVYPSHKQPRHDHSVSGRLPKPARPPLGGGESRGVEFLPFLKLVICSILLVRKE